MLKVKNRSLAHPDWPYICDEFCKVHWFWDFHSKSHVPYPGVWNIRMQAGWVKASVHVGPPAYRPYRPIPPEWSQMGLVCPHEQMRLDCNFCLRHMFRPMEI